MNPRRKPLQRGSTSRTRHLLLAAVFAIGAGSPSAARAVDLEGWGGSFGLFDVTQEEEAFEVGVDYQFAEIRKLWGVAPLAGVGVTTDEAAFVYGGIHRAFRLGDSPWFMVPKLAVTLFDRGDGKELGQTLQFRSGVDVLRELGSGTRVGFGWYHISNASMDEVNPGANSLLLRVTWPPK
jgi:hypothetical protein